MFQNSNGKGGNSPGKNETKKGNDIRIRFQFCANTKDNNREKTHNECLKELLYEMMMCAKMINKSASLRPWKSKSKVKNLNGYEIKMICGDDIENCTIKMA